MMFRLTFFAFSSLPVSATTTKNFLRRTRRTSQSQQSKSTSQSLARPIPTDLAACTALNADDANPSKDDCTALAPRNKCIWLSINSGEKSKCMPCQIDKQELACDNSFNTFFVSGVGLEGAVSGCDNSACAYTVQDDAGEDVTKGVWAIQDVDYGCEKESEDGGLDVKGCFERGA